MRAALDGADIIRAYTYVDLATQKIITLAAHALRLPSVTEHSTHSFQRAKAGILL